MAGCLFCVCVCVLGEGGVQHAGTSNVQPFCMFGRVLKGKNRAESHMPAGLRFCREVVKERRTKRFGVVLVSGSRHSSVK